MTRKRTKSDAARTCLGCRIKRERKEMIRIVRHPEGHAIFDVDARLPGRGAYVCPTPGCVSKLTSSSLSYHLKAKVALSDHAMLKAELASSCDLKIRNLLSIGLKSGQVLVGSHAAGEALLRGRVFLLVIAADTAPRTERRLLRHSGSVPVVRLADKTRLGMWLGRHTAGSAAVTDEGLALKLGLFLARLTSIESSSHHSKQG